MGLVIQKPWYKKSGGKIYGAEWDGSSNPAWTRTDDAVGFVDPSPAINGGTGSSPFDEIMPWAGMQIVEDAEAGTLVSIPKYYYKWTYTGNAMKLQISESQFDGSFVSPAHADRGDGTGERDVVYIGRYHCSSSNYKSASGVTPKVSIKTSSARSDIHNLGSTIWQMDFAMWWTVNMLYLVEYADWNSQAKIGYGCGNNSTVEKSGASNNMGYHTGTMKSSRTTYGVGCQYRHIEDWWGNVNDCCDGLYFGGGTDSSKIYAKINPSTYSQSSGGQYIGSSSVSGYISKWMHPSGMTGVEYALYPSAADGTDGTYVCDYVFYIMQTGMIFVGGSYSRSMESGAFCLRRTNAGSSSIGCRLMKLP